MPSKTEKQQKFFQIVKAYKDKKMSAAEVGKNVEDAAKDMSDKEVDKYSKLTKEDIDELRELLNMRKENVMPDVKPNDAENAEEGSMAKSQAKDIMKYALEIHKMINDRDDLPEWVESKITKAHDYMTTLCQYMSNELEKDSQAFKKTDEGYYSRKPKSGKVGGIGRLVGAAMSIGKK